jgi:hypothetical protein
MPPASQFNDLEGCKQGCMYLPDNIGERPWPMALLQSLSASSIPPTRRTGNE